MGEKIVLENTIVLKRDKSGIKKINSIILFLFILSYGGVGVYMISTNKLFIETAIILLIIYFLAVIFSFFKSKINSKKNAPFIFQCDVETLKYYPLIRKGIAYSILLDEVKDIHVLWWGNGANKITINFYQKPQFSTRTENDEEEIVDKTILCFERIDVSLKDFNNFFNSMNDKFSCPVIFDKR